MSNQNLKVGIIGCGYWGKNLVRNFHELGALAAISDPSESVAAQMSAQFSVPALSFDEILSKKDISGVVIAAPAALHADLATRALQAGKHVYVEKPLALDVKDAEALVSLARERGLCLMVGHLLQYHPAFLKLKELARAGELGELRHIAAERHNLGKLRSEEDVFWSFAPHDISMILSLAAAAPVGVTASAGKYLQPEIADVVTASLVFSDGLKADVSVSWLYPVKEQKLVVVGSKAMAVFNDVLPWPEKLQIFRHQASIKDGVALVNKAEPEKIALTEAEPLREECAHFLACMKDGKTPRTDGEEGLAVLRILSQVSQKIQPAAGSGAFVHESSYVDDGCVIGKGTKVWHFSHLLKGTVLGEDCVISQNVMIGPDVRVGNRCKIQNNVSLYKGVELEDGVFCGPSCVFTNVLTPRAEVNRKEEFLKTRVGRGASIGANATIICGHDLGEYCMIAAGAVVTCDVPAFALMAGVPARRIGWVSQTGDRLDDSLTCPRTGQKYALDAKGNLMPSLVESAEKRKAAAR